MLAITPLGLKSFGVFPQGSACRATLGFVTKSLRDLVHRRIHITTYDGLNTYLRAALGWNLVAPWATALSCVILRQLERAVGDHRNLAAILGGDFASLFVKQASHLETIGNLAE